MIGLGGKQCLLCLSLVIWSCGPGEAQLFFDPIDGLGLVPPPGLRDDLGDPYLPEPSFLTRDARARSRRATQATSNGPAPAAAPGGDASSPGPAAAPAPAPVPADTTSSSAEALAEMLLADPFQAELLQPPPPPPPAHQQQPPAPAPGARAGNSSTPPSAHAQPTQIKDLLAPSPPSPAVPPTASAVQGPTASPPAPAHAGPGAPDAARSDRGRSCDAQGLVGECNACVCCCTPAGGGAFVSYMPDACDCRKQLSRPDVALALVLGAVALIPALLVSCYLGDLLPLSPYKRQQQGLPTAAIAPAPAAAGA